MKNYRYGKFRFRDFLASWFAIIVFLFFSITALVLDLSVLFIVFPLLLAIVRLVVIIIPQFEKFSINTNSITVFLGKKEHVISLPEEFVLVVSNADFYSPLAVRTPFGNETHILKDKIFVSIIAATDFDSVLDTIHRNPTQKYTSSIIKSFFEGYRYIYGFVCNQSLFDELIASKKCRVIIPESLAKEIVFDARLVDVYIDRDR